MSDWRALFAPAPSDEAARRIPLRVVRKAGRELLILPRVGRAAAQALTLYPAQTRLARWAKGLLHAALSLGLPGPWQDVELAVSPTDPLVGWLQEMTSRPAPVPFAILAGNPDARGRRFVLLVFRGDTPVAVAKVGADADARALIERESGFIQTAAPNTPHLPRLLGIRQTGRWSGLALAFVDGASPSQGDFPGMRSVLGTWIDRTRRVPLDELAAWRRLTAHAGGVHAAKRLAQARVHPALFHGDFAPWNVRRERDTGQWTVLDWERGELAGIPGWDWFHWLIHISVLVQRHDTLSSMGFLDDALRNPHFTAYAGVANISGLERPLLAAYLCYLHEFIVPPEIKAMIARLRDASAGWL